MTISLTNNDGISLFGENTSLTYMYGLSDFWATMFQDPETIETILRANSLELSEVYSRFLQLTSTISLSDIQVALKSQIKLILLKTSDEVPGSEGIEYYLPETVISSRYICNRPFLPTETLEEGVHFRISENRTIIRFSKPLVEFNFPMRQNQQTTEYALWALDAEADEQLIFDYFGYLLTSNREPSTEQFKSFINGLFFVYANGPTLELFKKGLNLAIGIPLSRGDEQVLSILQYEGSDNWVVVTDANSYIIPYGLLPSVEVNDFVTIGQQLADWIEVKDYERDGEWWINLSIPRAIIPEGNIVNRVAAAGSEGDYLMRNFLKTHTFLVLIQVGQFYTTEHPSTISTILKKIRPTYTYPFYVWLVKQDDTLEIEEVMQFIFKVLADETVFPGIDQFDRYSHASRIEAIHMRYDAPIYLDRWTGEEGPDYTPRDILLEDGSTYTVTDYIAPKMIYEKDPIKVLWFKSVLNRGKNGGGGATRGKIGRGRHVNSNLNGNTFKYIPSITGMVPAIDSDRMYSIGSTGFEVQAGKIPFHMGITIPLYVTVESDVIQKLDDVGYPGVTLGVEFGLYGVSLVDNYSGLFHRDSSVTVLGSRIPEGCYSVYAPTLTEVSNLEASAYLYFSRITTMDGPGAGVWSVHLCTFSVLDSWRYRKAYTVEDLTIKGTGPFTRGSVRLECPMGYLRGAPTEGNPQTDHSYYDSINTTPVTMDRDVVTDSSSIKLEYTSRDN